MDWPVLLYLVPYLISLAISIAVAGYAWRHRAVAGARPYALVALLGSVWTLGYVFELLGPSLEAKIFWDNVQWAASLFWPLALLAFALEFTGRKLARPRRAWGLLAAVNILFLLLVVTDPLHRLVRPDAWLVSGEPFPALVYDFSVTTWIMIVYGYGLVLAGLVVLVRALIRPHRLYRAQIGTILLGALIPIVGTLLTAFGVAPPLHRDTWPLTFALGNLVVIWGLVRYRLFDVVPVARDAVIESMSDAVMVLDVQNRVIDLNPAGQALVGRALTDVIGQPASVAFAGWPHLVEKYRDVGKASEEITLGTGDDRRHYGLTLSPVRDRRNRLAGRLVIVRDITARKEAQAALKKAHGDLERRVEERTTELLAANVELEAEIGERKRAEEALQRRTEELEALHQMALEITAQLDLDTLLHSIVSRAMELLGSRIGGLYLHRPDRDVLEMAVAIGVDVPIVGITFQRGEGLAGKVWESGEPLIIDDYLRWEGRAAAYDGLDLRAVVGVPIRWGPAGAGEKFLGVLDVVADTPGVYSPSDAELLSLFATEAAIAIENARLYKETLRSNRELALLNRVIAASAAGHEITTVLETACRELARAFDLPYSVAIQVDSKKTEAIFVAEYRIEGRISRLGQTVPLASIPLARDLLQAKTPLVVEDAKADPRLGPIRDLFRPDEANSLLVLPLLDEEELVGSLGMAAAEPRTFAPEEVDLARRVADQVSGALARARLEEERQELEKQLHQAQRMEALGRLAGGIAHDFNNLLTVTQLSTQMMQRQLHPDDPLQPYVQQIRETGERATQLVRQLLSFSRQDIAKPHLLALDDVIGELIPMLRRIIGEDIELTRSLAGDLWLVKADRSQIEQVIVNLVVNARDAMPEGGALILEAANVVLDETYAATHVDARPGEHVMLAITDTGTGMDDEVQAHIFEPFFTTKEVGRGTGLGLATVFGIVTQSGGHIHVYSEVGRGTTFRIYLPHAQETEAPASPRPGHPATGESFRGTETILLVEDEAAVRNQAVQVLESYGYRVLAAPHGAEALKVSRQHQGPIHLLLTDVVMPQLGGVELAKQLRAQRPEMRLLYMSGYAAGAVTHHGVLDGDAALLPKPFTVQDLTRKVREVLDSNA